MESLRTPPRGSDTGSACGAPAAQLGDAGDHLPPAGRVGSPLQPVRSAHWIWSNGMRRVRAIDAELDQLAGLAGDVGLGPHPLRLHRLGRPDHHHRLGRAQPLLDHLGVGPVGRKLVVAPHPIAQRAQGLGHRRACGRRARVGDEDVGHAACGPASSRPGTLAMRASEGQGKRYRRGGEGGYLSGPLTTPGAAVGEPAAINPSHGNGAAALLRRLTGQWGGS